jgi:Bacterial Ig-like domain (group 1)
MVIVGPSMAEQRPSITLGYDGSRWTAADIEAEIQSVSEPDRKVPLTMQLVGQPDIFEYSKSESASENALAKVTLKADATLPPSLTGTIEIIADPATEIAMGLMQAMSPIAIPQIKLPQMRATVDVHLVPYDLRLTWNDSLVYHGQVVELDGDGKSVAKLKAEVIRVNGQGQQVGEPEQAKFSVKPKWKEAEWVELQQASTGQALDGTLTSKKAYFKDKKDLGTLMVEAEVKGSTIRRELRVSLLPLSVSLVAPDKVEIKAAEQAKVEVVVTNSRNEGVSGVPVAWSLSPELGTLAPTKGATNGEGRCTVTYTAPKLEDLETESTTVNVTATVGPDKDWQDQVSFTVLYARQVTVTFRKQGFKDVTRKFELTAPGPLTVKCMVEGTSIPIAEVAASGAGVSGGSDSSGNISLAFVETGSGQEGGTVSMPLDAYCRGWYDRILRELDLLTHKDWTTPHLDKSSQAVKQFVEEDFVKRLASEPVASYDNTMLNIKMLASVVRVGDKARALFRRRYARMSGEIEQFFINLAGAIFAFLGEKIMAKVAGFVSGAARRFFGWLSSKVSKSDMILGLLKRGTTRVAGLISKLEELLISMKNKLAGRNAPSSLLDRVPKKAGDGPFKAASGLLDNKAFKELMEEATKVWKKAKHLFTEAEHAARKAAENLKNLETSLSRARVNLGNSTNPKTIQKWEREIRDLVGDIGNATQNVASKDEALKAARESLEAAQKSLASAESVSQSAGIFDNLLGSIMGCFNRVYLLCQLCIVFVCSKIVDLSSETLDAVLHHWHPRMGESLKNMIDDKVFKPLFQLAVGSSVGKGLASVVELTLLWTHSNMMSSSLDASLRHCGEWKDYDKESMREALKYYFNDIDAASFRTEVNEIWVEYIADVLDWIEFVIVWGVRIANVIVTILGVLAAAVSFGTSLIALVAFKAGVALFTEALDRGWDVLKAVCRGLTAFDAFLEVAGIVMPAHAAFTAKLYSDESIYDAADRAARYSIDDRLNQQMQALPSHMPPQMKAIMDKVDKLELEDSLPVEGLKFVKETDAASPIRYAGGKVWDHFHE